MVPPQVDEVQRSGIADSRTGEEVAEVAGVWASVVGL